MRKPSAWSHLTFLVLLCGSSAVGQSSPETSPEYSFTISASQPWTDTGIDLSAGDSLAFNAQSKAGSANDCNPNGAGSNSSEKLPLSSAPNRVPDCENFGEGGRAARWFQPRVKN